MKFFLLRVVLMAVVWAALVGSFDLLTLLAGAVVGALVLWFLRPLYESDDPAVRSMTVRGSLRQLFWVVELLGFFLYELTLSSLQVAREVLRPQMRLRPGVIALELDAHTDLEITALANLISLTPGTLSLEVSSDNTVLYIHAMFVDSEEATETRAYIKHTLERRVMRALGESKGPG